MRTQNELLLGNRLLHVELQRRVYALAEKDCPIPASLTEEFDGLFGPGDP